MISGERKCWHIVILDDSISESDVEVFYVYLFRFGSGQMSARVYITDNDKGMCSSSRCH